MKKEARLWSNGYGIGLTLHSSESGNPYHRSVHIGYKMVYTNRGWEVGEVENPYIYEVFSDLKTEKHPATMEEVSNLTASARKSLPDCEFIKKLEEYLTNISQKTIDS